MATADDAMGPGHHEHGLSPADLGADPVAAFQRWFDAAVHSGMVQPDAMVLATVDPQGRPAARAVLLKGADSRGLRFFTNLDSAKAHHLAANPMCAVALVWPSLYRQVRVTGWAQRVPEEESAAYFATRPRGSRLGAWASRQSAVIAGREVLDRRWAELEAAYEGTDDIPLPPFWGGYVVVPDTFEFWQGRRDRLHDRLRYVRALPDGPWRVERLAP
ncbi:MAG: pyridoxamine 5'-phosphate oxidase [Acidimicrobiales bacterium]